MFWTRKNQFEANTCIGWHLDHV